MFLRATILAAASAPFFLGSAMAQTDMMQMARLSSANQLGVMEYCQSNGWTDQTAVDAQKKAMAALPAATDTTGLQDAETSGKQGNFLANGNKTSLTQIASGKNTTVQALCGQLGDAAKSAATRMAAMHGGMPGMTGSMPSMPAMPSMNSMPGALGAAPK